MKDKLQSFTANDYELVKRELLYKGVFTLVRQHLRHRLFKGGWSEVFTREVLERRHAAGILPYDPKLDQVILLEQFRPGSITDLISPWLLEVVAGTFDENETPTDVAMREAEEEANCKILNLHKITEYYVSPGGTNEYLHLYCGQVDTTNAGGIFGLANEHEDIKAFVLPVERAFELLAQGLIKTSPAIIALQWLQLNREWLKEIWLKEILLKK